MEQLRTLPQTKRPAAKLIGRKCIACIFGTRLEAIRMAPVIRALAADPGTKPLVILTGQNRELLDHVTGLFGLDVAAHLNVMQDGQNLGDITAAILQGLAPVLEDLAPDCVLVHGDTTTTFAASLAAVYAGIPVGHMDAGVRTGDMGASRSEGMNSKLVAQVATVHFTPTTRATETLIREGVDPGRIEVTGNTAIDALAWVRETTEAGPGIAQNMAARFDWLDSARRLVLVTGDWRGNQGGGLAQIAGALIRLAGRGDVQVAWPVDLTPEARRSLDAILAHAPGAGHTHIIEPPGYRASAWLMGRAELIITDSGIIQEEAPFLDKPVLVASEDAARPEAVEAGTVRLAGTSTERLTAEASYLLDDWGAYRAMASAPNPYGDGNAAGRIQARLVRELAR